MFPKKRIYKTIGMMMVVVALQLVIFAGLSEHAQAGQELTQAEFFANLHNVGAGILFDARGNLFAGTEDALVKIAPDGTVATVCSLSHLPLGRDYYFLSPLIWQMVWDREGNIIAAAQDRILKIAPDGGIKTLIQKNSFGGFLGASGVEIDRDGNIYITDGGKVVKYSPAMKPTVFIDCTKEKKPYTAFFCLNFDPEHKKLYVSDFSTRSLLRFPITPDGRAGEPVALVENIKEGAPLNMVFGRNGNIYVSVDISSKLLKISPDGQVEWINMGAGANHMIAFGGEGFDEESLYFTTYNGKVYHFNIGEKGNE